MIICPICREKLLKKGNSMICPNNHCFDFARQGYINLLPVQQKKSLHPGDTKEMLISRREFLSKGFYAPLKDKIISLINTYSEKRDFYLDIGCGEGYYTQEIASALNFKSVIGTDIAKDGVKMCCSRTKDILWTVATASHLPLCDGCTDVITAVFSLLVPEEYQRVLKKEGIIVEVSAGNNHLIELKREIYEDVFVQNKKQRDVSEIFKTIYSDEIVFGISLFGDDLKNLLTMTPHINRIKESKKQKLFSLDSLDLTVDCKVRVLANRY